MTSQFQYGGHVISHRKLATSLLVSEHEASGQHQFLICSTVYNIYSCLFCFKCVLFLLVQRASCWSIYLISLSPTAYLLLLRFIWCHCHLRHIYYYYDLSDVIVTYGIFTTTRQCD